MESDMLPWTEYSSFTISLLAILTPFAAVPIFLSLTAGLPSSESARVAAVAAATAALVLVVAALLGQLILSALGTSVGSLRVGGGLVLLLMAFSALNPREAPPQRAAEPGRDPIAPGSSGIVPLGLPVLAGPGAISAVIAEISLGAGFRHDALVIACILWTCGSIWALLRLARTVARNLGPGGLTLMKRLFGMLTASIAVEIITNGLRTLFPILG
jgi:multiple antibiotic resistance protein